MILSLQGKGKAPAKSSKVLQPTTSHNQSNKAIEDIYQKKSQLEHILLRPDTYIGAHQNSSALMHSTPLRQAMYLLPVFLVATDYTLEG